jgi:N-acetylglucosamine kinase-like BadF-type ATPase
MTWLVGVDVGKTGCRAALADGVRRLVEAEGPGAPGLADPGGVEAAEEAVAVVVARVRDLAGLTEDETIDAVCVGAAGSEAAGDAVPALLVRLPDRLHARAVALTSDAVTSHAGSLAGEPGAVVAVGTGSVAIGIGPGGFHQVDGHGYWLGDEGSGAWIGRLGLRAALRASDGRGAPTTLTDAARTRYAGAASLHAAVTAHQAIAADTAAFARDVLACAEAGDAIADEIVAAAGSALAESVAAAARASQTWDVTAIGGLTGSRLLMAHWRRALPDAVTPVKPRGTALDGALLLAMRTGLPHEAQVRRSVVPS